MNAAAVDKDGRVIASARQKTLPEQGPEKVIARMADLICSLVFELGAQLSDLRAVCVGVPGGVDDQRGLVDKAPNLGWDGVPLREVLSAQIGGARVFLDNDVRVAVLGEYDYGVGRGTRN